MFILVTLLFSTIVFADDPVVVTEDSARECRNYHFREFSRTTMFCHRSEFQALYRTPEYAVCLEFHKPYTENPSWECKDGRSLALFAHPNYKKCFHFHRIQGDLGFASMCLNPHLLAAWDTPLYQECYIFHHSYGHLLPSAFCQRERNLEAFSHPYYSLCYSSYVAHGMSTVAHLRCLNQDILNSFAIGSFMDLFDVSERRATPASQEHESQDRSHQEATSPTVPE